MHALVGVLALTTAGVGFAPTPAVAQSPSPSPAAPTAAGQGNTAGDTTRDSTRLRSTISFGPRASTVRVGTTTVRETSAPVTWALSRPGGPMLRLATTPLAYRAIGTSIAGAAPVSGRLTLPLRRSDTLLVYGSTRSTPGVLDSAQLAALGAVNTGTVDLDAWGLGTPARVGAQYATGRTADDARFVRARVALERQPRPTGPQATWWQGTTLRGGVTVGNTSADDEAITRAWAGADLSRSWADSLGGRNLFQGGGMLAVDAGVERNFGLLFEHSVALRGFYSRPFGRDLRTAQPNRLIPVGAFMGASVDGALAWRDWTLFPAVSLTRESSQAGSQSFLSRAAFTASGWSLSPSLAAAIPVGRRLDLVPELGATMGRVGATYRETTVITLPGSGRGVGGRPFARPVTTIDGFRDAIRGWWWGIGATIR